MKNTLYVYKERDMYQLREVKNQRVLATASSELGILNSAREVVSKYKNIDNLMARLNETVKTINKITTEKREKQLALVEDYTQEDLRDVIDSEMKNIRKGKLVKVLKIK